MSGQPAKNVSVPSKVSRVIGRKSRKLLTLSVWQNLAAPSGCSWPMSQSAGVPTVVGGFNGRERLREM